MQWYYSKNGIQLGPISEGEIRSKLSSGEIRSTDLVWRDGMTDWTAAAKVAEFSSLTAPAAVVVSPVDTPPRSPYTPPTLSGEIAAAAQIPNYLWQSIVVTLFCCLPFGIVAIIFAARVDGLKQAGDVQGAVNASKKAKTWCLAAVITSVVLTCCYVGIVVIFGVMSRAAQ